MLYFETPGDFPIAAATTMGVSVKDTDNPIGKFGTGLKYAIAGILRMGGYITIQSGEDKYEFALEHSSIRGRDFFLVTCNGTPCGYTTELGKHWQPWMLFRELASNTLDENGVWGKHPTFEHNTIISVSCRELEEAEKDQAVFRPKAQVLYEFDGTLTMYDKPSPYFYYRGIRVGDFPCPYLFDLEDGSLSEDRTMDTYYFLGEVSYFLNHGPAFSDGLLHEIATAEKHSFWDAVMDRTYAYSEKRLEQFSKVEHLIKHPRLIDAVHKHMLKKGKRSRPIKKIGVREDKLISRAERMCKKLGMEPIPRDKLFLTEDLGQGVYGQYDTISKEVYINTSALAGDGTQFLKTYLEENIHRVSGASDYSRNFQEFCLDLLLAFAPRR